MSKSAHEGGPYYYVAPWPTRNVPPQNAKTEVPWCMRNSERYDGVQGNARGHGENAAFGKVRCPKCGRRLQLMTVDIENGYGDFWPYIPPHKVRKLSIVKKDQRKRKQRGNRQ